METSHWKWDPFQFPVTRSIFMNKSINGRKAYNNGQKVIYLFPEDPIPEGFIKGGLSTRNHDSYVKAGNKSAITQKIHWNNKSNEEKAIWSTKCRIAQNSLSDDQKKIKIEKTILTNSLKSDKEKAEINLKRHNSCKKYWDNLIGEDRRIVLEDKIEKTSKTCLERYGVPFACMREEARMSGNNSIPNKLFSKLLDYYHIQYDREFILGTKQFDFKISDVLIEINPSYTHSSTIDPFGRKPLDKFYHFNKSKLANENGFRCLHVWDWDDYDKVIKLFLNREIIYARNCEVKIIDLNITREYLNNYHLQGYVKSKINLGLFYNNILISVMTFGKPRYNKNYEYELLRYCSNYSVIGGVEKLFKYFLNNYNPSSIISYCDLSKFSGSIYKKLGFIQKNISIGKHWYNQNSKVHITDNLLRQRGFDQLFGTSYGVGISNDQLMRDNGFLEIYDAGQASYSYLT